MSAQAPGTVAPGTAAPGTVAPGTVAPGTVAPGALRRRHVATVAAAHCASAFAALGLPPYLSRLLPELGDPSAAWAGLLYVLPTLCTALAAPMWGGLADRYGPKPLLVRAQLGLAVAFGLAACAQDVGTLALALALQGLLGGTYAASTAYLGGGLAGDRLAGALALMQGSARTALVVAPLLAGVLSTVLDVRAMYGLAALLPLAAAGATLVLAPPGTGAARAEATSPAAGTAPAPGAAAAGTAPAPDAAAAAGTAPAPGAAAPAAPERPATITVWGLCLAEAGFVLVTVATYPYFVPLASQLVPGLPPAAAGALFAAPHVCYLAAAWGMLRLLRGRARLGLTLGYAFAAASAAAHLVPVAVPALVPAWAAALGSGLSPLLTAGAAPAVWLAVGRLLLGAALAFGLPALSLLGSEAAAGRKTGRLFGRVESGSKAGAVLAGASASGAMAAGALGLGAAAPLVLPVLAGAALAAAAPRFTAPRPALRPDVRQHQTPVPTLERSSP
ncbi:MFS transporter [Sinomonas mesophila]|uniref:MFS transporter n=1 Tax=Sinomonas mesophila TaxID=1531955 RepID=UPI001C37D868|nr:MFS transporter [Sinomonas mesophila]